MFYFYYLGHESSELQLKTRKIRTPPFWDTPPPRLKLNLTSRVYHERTGLKPWPEVRPEFDFDRRRTGGINRNKVKLIN